jgi:mannose-6-phosphate isomerase class I
MTATGLGRLLQELRAGSPRILKLRNDNLVERPWGGRRLLEYKGLDESVYGRRYGEAFEVSAFADDDEARRHPSLVELDDAGSVKLAEVLAQAGPEVLGSAHVCEHGPNIALLPKTVDVVELLSVQAHPPGQIELYIILAADPGATIRLGLRQQVQAERLTRELEAGRRQQEQLLAMLRDSGQQPQLQSLLAPNLACRQISPRQLLAAVGPLLAPDADLGLAERLLGDLHVLYWRVLDLLNEIPVQAGQVILNATPERLAGRRLPSAELHALGNPARREILMVEVRRPGITLRAWDNVRFPLRDIEVSEALRASNLRATTAADFRIEPEPDPHRDGVFRLVERQAFTVYLLRSCPGRAVLPPAPGTVQTLHVIDGQVQVLAADGQLLACMSRGESAVVPVSVGAYRIEAVGQAAQLVQALA